MSDILSPSPDSIIYEDTNLYVCLATFPLTYGHTIVVWKEHVADLHLLSSADYLTLMGMVEKVRNLLLHELSVEKVYLMYMDEVRHVHWHLIPRHNEKGYNVFKHDPEQISDFSLALALRRKFTLDST